MADAPPASDFGSLGPDGATPAAPAAATDIPPSLDHVNPQALDNQARQTQQLIEGMGALLSKPSQLNLPPANISWSRCFKWSRTPKATSSRQSPSLSPAFSEIPLRFLFQVNNYFASAPHKFDTDHKKILFLSSRLEGTALTWFMGLLQQNAHAYVAVQNADRLATVPPLPPLAVEVDLASDFSLYPATLDTLKTWRSFVGVFHQHFGDVDARANAARKLSELQQTTSVSAYASIYKSYCYHLNDTEQRMASNFYDKLKPAIKDEIHRLGKPNTLAAMIEMAIRADNRQMERSAEHRDENTRGQGTFTPFRSSFALTARQATNTGLQFGQVQVPATAPVAPYTPTAPSNTGVVPMQLDATTVAAMTSSPRGLHLTPEERQRRLVNGLSLYCGGEGHRRDGCLNRPANSNKAPNRFRNTTASVIYVEDEQAGNDPPQ